MRAIDLVLNPTTTEGLRGVMALTTVAGSSLNGIYITRANIKASLCTLLLVAVVHVVFSLKLCGSSTHLI